MTHPSQPQPNMSIIIVSFNTREVLRGCLSSLQQQQDVGAMQVIVVDNASRDGSADMVARDFPHCHLVRSEVNLGFAAANNLAFALAGAPYLVLLNPDALLQPGALKKSIAHMESTPRAGLAGGLLQDSDGQLQPSGRLFPSLLNELLMLSGLAARYPASRFFGRFDRTWANPRQAAPVDWVPGAFSIIRRSALDISGGFDERFFLYYEEVDLCRRIAQAGYEVWYWPDVVIEHIGGASSKTLVDMAFSGSGSQLTLWRLRSGLLYYRKHHGPLAAWMVNRLELGWHRLRAWKNASREQKRAQSQREAALIAQAWADTRGGSSSPLRPW
jgi:GT2 family glycosyltransferase